MSGGNIGAPGVLSPFNLSTFETGAGQSELAMGNRYNQLGLGQTSATPTSAGSLGTGTTAEQMDLGTTPSLTGGIPTEFLAGLGQTQSGDLGQSLAAALSNLNTSNTKTSSLLGTALK